MNLLKAISSVAFLAMVAVGCGIRSDDQNDESAPARDESGMPTRDENMMPTRDESEMPTRSELQMSHRPQTITCESRGGECLAAETCPPDGFIVAGMCPAGNVCCSP